ncbi:hypothetical protein QQM79_02005 [Marinobacteraceae bacterium S3BR75-40.1]
MRHLFVLSLLLAWPLWAAAGEREQAKRIHDRLAGVPPTETVLTAMAADIAGGNAEDAAYTAMENSAFYDVTLKNFVAPWTNEEMSQFVPLNDYTATVIGMVRDNVDFRKILYDNILYVADSSLGLPAYSSSNNDQYEQLEQGGYSLKDNLVQVSQSSRNGLPAEATAGIMTTRAAAKAFFIAGTNRAMFRFTLLNHLCNDMEQVNDITRPPDRIRQDVSRSPGGDSRIFLNNCVGCHSGMDPMAQAYAYYDYEYDADNDPTGENGHMVYNTAGMTDPDTGTRVQAKYHINASNFEFGYVTPDDSWDNYWRSGPNRRLGWDAGLSGSGEGAKTMGKELAHSDAFAECQVKKVFKNVCLRSPVDSTDRSQIASMVSSFKSSGYNLKQVFAESAVYCMGD